MSIASLLMNLRKYFRSLSFKSFTLMPLVANLANTK